MEASGGSLAWWLFAHVDIGKEEPKTLEEINPHWRAQQWLQVAVQGSRDEEVPWHKLLTPLASGVEGVAKSLAKHLVAACACAHPLPWPSTLASFLLMRRQRGHGRATLVHGLLLCTAVGG